MKEMTLFSGTEVRRGSLIQIATRVQHPRYQEPSQHGRIESNHPFQYVSFGFNFDVGIFK